MSKTAPVSVRLDAALNERVTAIAAALDRPKSWIIEQAVQDFVAVQKWQLAAIDEESGRQMPAGSSLMRMWFRGSSRGDALTSCPPRNADSLD